jgi:hypothetical protein
LLRRGRLCRSTESVTIAIEGCLTLPILERHKRDLMSGMLWKITEARGKFTTRYRSRLSMDGAAKLPPARAATGGMR